MEPQATNPDSEKPHKKEEIPSFDKVCILFNRSKNINPSHLSMDDIHKEKSTNLAIFYPLYPFKVTPAMFNILKALIEKAKEVAFCIFELSPNFKPSQVLELSQKVECNQFTQVDEQKMASFDFAALNLKKLNYVSDEKAKANAINELLNISLQHSSFFFEENKLETVILEKQTAVFNNKKFDELIELVNEYSKKPGPVNKLIFEPDEATKKALDNMEKFFGVKIDSEVEKINGMIIENLNLKLNEEIIEVSDKAISATCAMNFSVMETDLRPRIEKISIFTERLKKINDFFIANAGEKTAFKETENSLKSFTELKEKLSHYVKNSSGLEVLMKKSLIFQLGLLEQSKELDVKVARSHLTFELSSNFRAKDGGELFKFKTNFQSKFTISKLFISSCKANGLINFRVNGKQVRILMSGFAGNTIDPSLSIDDKCALRKNRRMVVAASKDYAYNQKVEFVELINQKDENIFEFEIFGYKIGSFEIKFCIYPEVGQPLN